MSDTTREQYLKAVNIICEQFGLDKPSQIIYICEAVDRLVEEYRIENEELKETVSRAGYRIAELKHEVDELKALHESDKKATALLMQKWEAERNELKKDKEWLDNTNNEQTKVILKLQAQIEKMKNCFNCALRESGDCIWLENHNQGCRNFNKWELAE